MKFDLQKREQLRFVEVNYLNYTKKDPILQVTTTYSLKQGETRTSRGPIPQPLTCLRRVSWSLSTDAEFGGTLETSLKSSTTKKQIKTKKQNKTKNKTKNKQANKQKQKRGKWVSFCTRALSSQEVKRVTILFFFFVFAFVLF